MAYINVIEYQRATEMNIITLHYVKQIVIFDRMYPYIRPID